MAKGLTSPEALKMQTYPPSALHMTVCGRIEQLQLLLNFPVEREDGSIEYVQLISKSLARRLAAQSGD